MLEALRPICEEAAKERETVRGTLSSLVENEVQKLLHHGKVNRQRVAKALGLSERTLSQGLADEDTNFDHVLDRLRRSLALQYVKERRISVDQIAWLLGYEGQTIFNYAFARWTGRSASEARSNSVPKSNSIRLRINVGAHSPRRRYSPKLPEIGSLQLFVPGERSWGRFGNDLTMIHEIYAVSAVSEVLEVFFDEENSAASFVQKSDCLIDAGNSKRRESDRRLVNQQDLRWSHDGSRDCKHPAFAATQRGRTRGGRRGDAPAAGFRATGRSAVGTLFCSWRVIPRPNDRHRSPQQPSTEILPPTAPGLVSLQPYCWPLSCNSGCSTVMLSLVTAITLPSPIKNARPKRLTPRKDRGGR